MQTNNANKPQRSGGTGLKFLVSAFSLAGILTFWNLFANKSFNDSLKSFMELLSPPAQPPAGTALNLPPMPVLAPIPTLVAIQEVNVPVMAVEPQSNPLAGASGNEVVPVANSQPALRVVGAPTPMPIVQTAKPVVEGLVPAGSVPSTGGGKKSGGGGSGGGGKSGSSK